LSRYEYYIDCRFSTAGTTYGEALPILSKTAFEALACGCKVIRWDGQVVEGLPEAHRPENVVKGLLMMYRKVLDPKRRSKC
jgi:hypothetical protein